LEVQVTPVRVERSGNRILLHSETPTPGLKASVPGAYFRKDGVWSMGLDLATCHLLRERFGNRLVIGPELTAWAKAEKATRARMDDLAAAADADLFLLPEVAPALFAAMNDRTYQRSGVRFIVDTHGRDDRRRALNADTVGLGKTAQGIGAMLESGQAGPYLVICPKGAVQSTWAREIRKWLGKGAEVITLPDAKSARQSVLRHLTDRYRRNPASLARTWVVVHPYVIRTQTWFICGQCGDKTKYKAGMVQELDTCGHPKDRTTKLRHDHNFHHLFEVEYGGIIADESDQYLIRKTGTPNLQRRGAEMLRDLVREGGIRLAMSGTPFRSKPEQIWSTLNWLDPIRWSAKWSFIEKFWEVTQGYYGGYTIGEFREDREELFIDELRDVMIRRTRDMVRDDMPPRDYPSNVAEDSGLTKGIYLEMTPEQEKAYRQMEKEGEAAIEGGTLSPIGTLAELTRLKQFAAAPGKLNWKGEFEPVAGGNKYDWLVDFLLQLGFPDKPATKLVFASQFTKILNVFAEGIRKEFKDKIRIGLITGEISTNVREQTIDAFEDAALDLNLLFINTKAGGSSITLDAAEIMVVDDETWVSDEQEQLEGRIDNRQPERRIVPRSYYYLRSVGTVEEGIARANAAAKARGERVLNGAAIARQAKEVMR
jgi:hypothetical protein